MKRTGVSMAVISSLVGVSFFGASFLGFQFDSLVEYNEYKTENRYVAPPSNGEFRAAPRTHVEGLDGTSVQPIEGLKAHPATVVDGLNGLRIDD